jgi:hypothetical protein
MVQVHRLRDLSLFEIQKVLHNVVGIRNLTLLFFEVYVVLKEYRMLLTTHNGSRILSIERLRALETRLVTVRLILHIY